MCEFISGHEAIYFSIAFLTVMVLGLFLIGLLSLRTIKAMALRISYLEGTTDLIYESQERFNKLIVVYMENA